jgi:hypothetical protein
MAQHPEYGRFSDEISAFDEALIDAGVALFMHEHNLAEGQYNNAIACGFKPACAKDESS